MQRILRLPQVLERTTLSRSMIYKLMGEGDFPAPVKLGTRAVAWREADVDSWIEGRAPAREAA